jgi:hypothetical protein
VSTSTKLGSVITHEGKPHFVVRMVESDTLFETETGCYILHEQYAELRTEDGSVVFLPPFVAYRTEFLKDPTVKQKGLDPVVWRRF